jgi:hypothetical protein
MITEQSQVSQAEIDRVLARLAVQGIGKSTKPVLGVHQLGMMKARNNGYPLDLYHSELDPRQALNESQEEMLVNQGYGRAYITHQYPKMMFRRNLTGRFRAEISGDGTHDRPAGTPDPAVDEFVEARQVMDKGAEEKLLKERTPQNCSKWCASRLQVDEEFPMPEAEIDQSNQIARLQGQIEELRRQEAMAQAQQQPPKPIDPPLANPQHGKAVGEVFRQDRPNKP